MCCHCHISHVEMFLNSQEETLSAVPLTSKRVPITQLVSGSLSCPWIPGAHPGTPPQSITSQNIPGMTARPSVSGAEGLDHLQMRKQGIQVNGVCYSSFVILETVQ